MEEKLWDVSEGKVRGNYEMQGMLVRGYEGKGE